MLTLEVIRETAEVVAVMAMICGATIHILKLDDQPWARTFLALSNDFIGAMKAHKKGADDAKSDST